MTRQEKAKSARLSLACLRDLNDALPHLKKSELGLMNNLSYWGMALKQMGRLADFELLLKGNVRVDEEGRKTKGRRA